MPEAADHPHPDATSSTSPAAHSRTIPLLQTGLKKSTPVRVASPRTFYEVGASIAAETRATLAEERAIAAEARAAAAEASTAAALTAAEDLLRQSVVGVALQLGLKATPGRIAK